MPPVMFSVVTKYHKGRHSLFLYNSEIFYAFTQDLLRSPMCLIWLLYEWLGCLSYAVAGGSVIACGLPWCLYLVTYVLTL